MSLNYKNKVPLTYQNAPAGGRTLINEARHVKLSKFRRDLLPLFPFLVFSKRGRLPSHKRYPRGNRTELGTLIGRKLSEY